MKHWNDVFDFHAKFDLPRNTSPTELSANKLRDRAAFLIEELIEFADAANLTITCYKNDGRVTYDESRSNVPADYYAQADALIDLVYVALGTAVMMGLPWDALWDDVHAANMRKVKGMSKRGMEDDVTKPIGWRGPQTKKIIDAYVKYSEENNNGK